MPDEDRMELLTALGLSASAGLNAYIPMLIVGLAARTSVVDLPSAWRWLENPWTIGIVALLLLVEFVADKVPAVDHVNDVIQTVVRPTSGGLVVGAAGWGGQAFVNDPQASLAGGGWVPVSEGGWVPMLGGALVALAVHLAKAGLRGVANAVTAGFAAPVLSTAEDGLAVGLSVAALLAPLLVLVGVALLVAAILGLRRRAAARRMSGGGRPPATV